MSARFFGGVGAWGAWGEEEDDEEEEEEEEEEDEARVMRWAEARASCSCEARW